MKRAFTLIELLVVIAIIAILAAILFPVFAQAKAAAKGTAALSNAKQTGLAMFMYTADVDDTAPIDATWNNGVGPLGSGTNLYATWAHNLFPYMKTTDLLQDPQTTPDALIGSLTKNNSRGLFTQFGYNYSTWSPVTDTSVTPWPRQVVSMTTPAAPAETVLLVSKHSLAEIGGGVYYYGPGTAWASNSAEPPDCYSRASLCFAGWGVSTNYTPVITSVEAGKYTGGNSIRRSGNAVVVLGDGHAAAMKPGRLAAGTNYIAGSTTQNESAIVVNDLSKYMWDVN